MIKPTADRWCSRLVELAASMLPPAQRQRYALEFIAELYGMPRAQQVRHSVQVLASAWHLRAALAEASPTPIREDIMTATTTVRPLRCRLGRHLWHWTSTEDGDRFECCIRCGQDRTEKTGASPWRGAAYW